MPRLPACGSVRARVTNQCPIPALVIQAFSPSITQLSPSRRATVFMAPGSLPAPGSVRQNPPRAAPEASEGSTRCLRSGDPKRSIGQPQTELVTDIVTPIDGQ